eukprot:2387581-Ditylum_brightwellii.AAC.1
MHNIPSFRTHLRKRLDHVHVGHIGNGIKNENSIHGTSLELGHVSTLVLYESTAGRFPANK